MGTDCRNIAIREVIIVVSLKITDFCDMMPCSPVQWKLLSIIRTGDGSRFVPYVCTYIWDQMASLPTRQLSLQQRHCSEVLKQWQILKKKKKWITAWEGVPRQLIGAASHHFPIKAVKHCTKTHLCESIYYHFKINFGNFSLSHLQKHI